MALPYLAAFAVIFFIVMAILGSYLGKRAAAQVRAQWAAIVGPDNLDIIDMNQAALWAEIKFLRKAIREHRDERGHDRCWLDDVKLYASLPERTEADQRLPPRDAFLANCERYHAHRQDPSLPFLREADVEAAVGVLIDHHVHLPLVPPSTLLPGVDLIPAKDLKAISRHTGTDLLRYEAGRSDALHRRIEMCDLSPAYMDGYHQGIRER